MPMVLIAEDETLIAMMLEGDCVALGYSATFATSVDGAFEVLATTKIDAAVLDVNLAGAAVFPVADRLAECAVPFAFLSGHSPDRVPERHRSRPFLVKPYSLERIAAVLEAMLRGHLERGACVRSAH